MDPAFRATDYVGLEDISYACCIQRVTKVFLGLLPHYEDVRRAVEKLSIIIIVMTTERQKYSEPVTV